MFGFVSPVVTGFGKGIAGASVSAAHAPVSARVSMKMSPCMPFMEQPAPLDDDTIPGNVGFDPLALSTILGEEFGFKWMREAEIKHCRVAMLGVLGWVFTEFVRLPFPYFKSLDPVAAHDYFVTTGGMSQILLFVSAFEMIAGISALNETINGDREPGYFGFDPLGLGKNPASLAKFKVSEIKNGRLAMIAFGGFYHAFLVTKGQGVIYQLTHFTPNTGTVF